MSVVGSANIPVLPGVARVNDCLRALPGHMAVLLSVELCSLTLQRDDISIPALIGVCLFGDGAARRGCLLDRPRSCGRQRASRSSHPGVA
jgi:predicted naringenin-chalcone synthase